MPGDNLMKATGWIVAAILLVILILSQLSIHQLNLACGDYKKAITIYRTMLELE